jgi:hypothetical protein
MVRWFAVLAFVVFAAGITLAILAFASIDDTGAATYTALLTLFVFALYGLLFLALSYILRLLLVLEGRTRHLAR